MHRRHISTSSKAADSIAGILSCYQTLRDTRGNHRNVFWDAKEASTKGRGILKKKQTNKKSKRKLKRTVSAQVGVGRVVWWWGEQWPVTFRELDQCLPMTGGKTSALQVRGVELTPPLQFNCGTQGIQRIHCQRKQRKTETETTIKSHKKGIFPFLLPYRTFLVYGRITTRPLKDQK